MTPRSLLCLLLLVPASLPAQTIDLNASRSAEQLRGGVQAFHRGFYNDAWTALEKAVSYQPSNALALAWLGRAQWKAGYEQEAGRTWQQLITSGNGSALVREWLNVLDFRRGLGKELSGTPAWVVSSVLDGSQKNAYPFRRPSSVRPRADGSFWVVAFGSNEVLRFDANFRLQDSFKGGLQGFDRPYDLVEADDGSFFVSEYGSNRIAKCGPGGEKVATFGTVGRGDGNLLGPQYLAMDGRGTLWVTDWGNSRVVRFDRDGKFIQAIAGISGPTGVAAHEDRLYVSEKSARHVLVFDLNGNRIAAIGDGVLRAPEGLSFSGSGTLLVADGDRIMESDLEREIWTVRGDVSAYATRLVQQAVTPNGSVLGVDFDQNRVLLLSDTTTLFAGLVVRVDRVNAVKFPVVYVSVSVENRFGVPVVGLGAENFILTESHVPVGAPALALSNTNNDSFDVALLIERSPALASLGTDMARTVDELYGLVTQGGRIKAISAAERPVKEADFGEARLRFVRQALQAAPSPQWRFDLGVRLAGDELITAVSGAKRTILFLTSGSLGSRPFSTYSLLEIAAYLKNSSVAFSAVVFGAAEPDEDLSYLVAHTGGKLYRLSDPGGMPEVVRDIKARRDSIYALRFTSRSKSEFGQRYIPLEAEVTTQKVSGRDESGYYGPAVSENVGQ